MIKKLTGMIPNTITCLNLFSGCVATVFAFSGDFTTAFWMVILAAVFDFLDGFAARLLKAYSPMGKELDSLADMVSFGIAPSVVFFAMGLGYPAFLIAVFSALRLAKFNIDTRQTSEFIGLATPSNALFFMSLGYVYAQPASILTPLLQNYWVCLGLVIAFSLLMVSEIPMFSLKFKNYGFRDNAVVFCFLAAALTGIVLFGIIAIPFIILTYIILNIIKQLRNKRQPK